MSPLKERMLRFIKNNPGCTYRDIEAFTGSAHRVVLMYKNNLVDLGQIREKLFEKEGGNIVKRFYPGKKK